MRTSIRKQTDHIKRKTKAVIALSLIAVVVISQLGMVNTFALSRTHLRMYSAKETSAVSSSGVKIGHPVHGERGALRGNKAGDQKNKEVYIEDWKYSILSSSRYHWKYVVRAKDHDLARAIAGNMEAICKNDNIGYDLKSPDNVSLYNKLVKNGWDIKGIDSKCETMCSNAVSVCLNAEGVNVPKDWKTRNMKDDLLATGLFECLSSKKYVRSSDYLVKGDILIYPGRHTAVVVESGNPFTYTLKYTRSDGKEVSKQIQEGSTLMINLNNSTEPYGITMSGDVNMADVKAELKNYVFTGWQLTKGKYITAEYRPERQLMKPKAKKIKL